MRWQVIDDLTSELLGQVSATTPCLVLTGNEKRMTASEWRELLQQAPVPNWFAWRFDSSGDTKKLNRGKATESPVRCLGDPIALRSSTESGWAASAIYKVDLANDLENFARMFVQRFDREHTQLAAIPQEHLQTWWNLTGLLDIAAIGDVLHTPSPPPTIAAALNEYTEWVVRLNGIVLVNIEDSDSRDYIGAVASETILNSWTDRLKESRIEETDLANRLLARGFSIALHG